MIQFHGMKEATNQIKPPWRGGIYWKKRKKLWKWIYYVSWGSSSPQKHQRRSCHKRSLAEKCLGGWICFNFLTSQMVCNFISKSAVDFFQISLRGVKSHIDMVPWCHNVVCPKRLRLSNESEGIVDGSEILLTSWYGEFPIIYKVFYIPGGAGFLPWAVWRHVIYWGCPFPWFEGVLHEIMKLRNDTSSTAGQSFGKARISPAFPSGDLQGLRRGIPWSWGNFRTCFMYCRLSRKKDGQKKLDDVIVKSLAADMKSYLKSRFSLTANMYPHELKFWAFMAHQGFRRQMGGLARKGWD